MAYTNDDLHNMGIKDLQDARKKIVDTSIFDHVSDVVLDDKTKKSLDYTRELYIDYLKELNNFKESIKEQILRTLMNTEVIDNHSVEMENINLLTSYCETHHSSAIRYLIKKLVTENLDINDNILKKTHEILMRGTSNGAGIAAGYRNNNSFYVGYIENGEKTIEFLPIAHENIKEAMEILFDYYNSNILDINLLFAKPFIVHGLLAALQVFEDGNTRMARTLQHINLYTLTNELDDSIDKFNLPAIYFSKNYIPFRYEYRSLIRDIALIHNNEVWNAWINFNLNRMQERIYANENSFMLLKKQNIHKNISF